MRLFTVALIASLIPACHSVAQQSDPAPATQPTVGHFPFLEVDARAKQVRVECEALRCENPLEFFLCVTGTNEYESVLRSKVRPSHLHAALLMLGLKPGEPVHYSESLGKWLPPHGPPLALTVTFEKDGKVVTLPAWRLMRDIKSKREMPPTTWIFAGSRILDNDRYAADGTGYLVSVVNFDLTVIDTPRLASNANETLEWETNLEVMPATGTKVTLIIEPAGKVDVATSQPQTGAASPPRVPVDMPLIAIDASGKIMLNDHPVESADQLPEMLKKLNGANHRVRVAIANSIEENPTARDVINVLSSARIRFDTIPQASAGAGVPSTRPTDISAGVHVDDELIARLRQKWEQSVAPHDAALRDAARTHYEVVNQLRAEQQRLIDEADKIQRLIDQLDKQYQDMTTPRPQ